MQTDIDPRDLIGHKAVDRNGDKIGTIDEVYLDDATGRPEWAAVRTGIFGRDAFVPLTTSEFSGDELRVPYDKSLVKESPDFGVGQHLSPAQELQLYRYYGLDTPVDGRPSAGDGSGSEPADLDFGTTAGRGTAVGTAAVGAAAANGTGTANAASTGNATSTGNTTSIGTSTGTGTTNGTGTANPAKPLGLHQSPPPVPSPAADLGKPSDPAPEAPVRTLATPLPTTTAPAAEPRPHAPAAPAAPPAAAPTAGTAHPRADPAASSPSGPVEITCREERLDISTEWHVLGTAKLRKYVTSEPVERRVAVVRERVRVERIPVGDAERAALSEKEIAEAVEEVTLREERPVVRKYLAPIERVRLVVERYTAEEVVRDELRREHVEVHDNTAAASTAVPSAAQAPARQAAHPAVEDQARPAPLRPLA
ncbi:PRC and DUF2382 domain-containing protein [Kitasatospora purpeofusca]|uniref:PRC and DUF2382 domain-containing protein n=1 Tax=Kitasatospora purpeofusca TaxID=67352 RepID=UPI002A5ADCDA|nr:PRC and DUF2382 domain-containing protein [Kitasatospora purpeofusca]MDY0813234.1 PRC and DUF2382 domain-containing protein [Kitasatospora purpeofusca]